MFSNRHGEYLDPRPSVTPLLDALRERLLRLEPGIVVQPPGPGPWTAYYRLDRLVALARPSMAGARGSIDVALLPIEMAGPVTDVHALDEPEFAEALALAVRLAPESPSRVAAEFGSGYRGGLAGAFLTLEVLASAGTGLIRQRRERRVARETGTEAALAILDAARHEAGRRANSLTLGCLAALGLGVAATVPMVWIGAWLAAAGLHPAIVGILYLLLPLVSCLAFRRIRRRYPSPPQRPIDRLGRTLVLGMVGLVGGIVIWIAWTGSAAAPVTAEQATWCLGSGSGYVANALAVLSIERTWTPSTAIEDPNFRHACAIAWEAAHP